MAFRSGVGTLCLPTFGAKWLAPRLHRFKASGPRPADLQPEAVPDPAKPCRRPGVAIRPEPPVQYLDPGSCSKCGTCRIIRTPGEVAVRPSGSGGFGFYSPFCQSEERA